MPDPPHAYPRDLAAYARERWLPDVPLPAAEILETLVSTAYHASFLGDEDRPVRFRLVLVDPDTLPPGDGPPSGLLRLRFDRPRPFPWHEGAVTYWDHAGMGEG